MSDSRHPNNGKCVIYSRALSSFTAECAENAEASEETSEDWNTLKLCALGDLSGDKLRVF